MSRQDDIAEKAVRKSTLKSLKKKKRSRLRKLKIELPYDPAIPLLGIYLEESMV